MFLPIGDTPNPSGRAYVTWFLIAANVTVYLFVSLPATMSKVNLNDPVLIDYLNVLGLHGRVSARDVYQQLSNYDLLVFSTVFGLQRFLWLLCSVHCFYTAALCI